MPSSIGVKGKKKKPTIGQVAGAPHVLHEEPEKKVMAKVTQSVFQGPLPPPQILSGYNDIEPGLVNRIVTMAEKNGAHVRDMERKEQQYGYWSQFLGQCFGFVLIALLIGSGAFLIYTGHTLSGFFGSVVGWAAILAFLVFKHRENTKKE